MRWIQLRPLLLLVPSSDACWPFPFPFPFLLSLSVFFHLHFRLRHLRFRRLPSSDASWTCPLLARPNSTPKFQTCVCHNNGHLSAAPQRFYPPVQYKEKSSRFCLPLPRSDPDEGQPTMASANLKTPHRLR